MKQQPTKQLIEQLNKLYIQTRSKYLVQFESGKYVTLTYDSTNKVVKFNDSMLQTHLKGNITYGVFAGGYFSKFLTFDVDCDNEAMSRWITLKLVDTLANEFFIERKDIHVSYSGNKGYHVDLFFDKQLKVDDLKAFYTNVLASIGTLPEGEIEFRPTWNQGVKIPLGEHQKTGNRCLFVDNETLEPYEESFEYFLAIEPMPSEVITENDIDLSNEQIEAFEEVVATTDVSVNAVDLSGALHKAAQIIEVGRLTESGSRHKVTYTLACFGNSQGWEREETVAIIMDVLLNTPKEYFSEGSTPDYWQSEANRLVNYVFDHDKTIMGTDKPFEIYKSEILAVLNAGTFRQKQLAYAMLVTSKRFGNIFYLTVNTAMKMVGTTSRATVQTGIKKLVENGFIEYHRKAEIDKAKSKELGQIRYKPNKYRLTFDKPEETEESVTVNKDNDLIEVALKLCTVKEIKQHVKRYEFDNRWKEFVTG